MSAEITLWHWFAFCAFVIIMLVLDLGVFHRHGRESSLRESALWTLFWCTLALMFNGLLWWWQGAKAGQEFLAGYLVEWSLSMDNVFVFAVIFKFFHVPRRYQHRVLFWGILGAVVMRLSFILIGSKIIDLFDFVLPILGLFLIYTGFKLASHGDTDVHPERNIVLRIARRYLPVTHDDHGNRFFARESGRLCVTPLFLVLLVVETTDVVFAVDSVPTIFGLVDKRADYFTFVVFTSNVFAILGLRALYFLLAGMMGMFRYLSYGLAAILVFVGIKMCAEYAAEHLGYVDHDHHLVPSGVSLAVVIGLLGVSIAASIVAARREEQRLLEQAAAGGSPESESEPELESEPGPQQRSEAGDLVE